METYTALIVKVLLTVMLKAFLSILTNKCQVRWSGVFKQTIPYMYMGFLKKLNEVLSMEK